MEATKKPVDRPPHDPATVRSLAAAIAVYRHARVFLEGHGIVGRDDLAFFKAALAATIHDGLGSTIVLVERNAHSHLDTIGRSMLEALGDLYNLCDTPNYLKSLQLDSARHVKAAAEDYIRYRHDVPDAAHILEVAKARAREAGQVIRELDSQKGPQLKTGDRVVAPGLPEDVQGLYTLSSFDTHNDLTALVRRHRMGDRLLLGRADPAKAVSALYGAMITLQFAISRANEFCNATTAEVQDAFNAMRPHIDVVQHAADELLGVKRPPTTAGK